MLYVLIVCRRPNIGPPEVTVWAIFHCMALGLCNIANGSEDPRAGPREGGMITHFDIKPANCEFPQSKLRTYILTI